jgi:uncharacterized protein (DUF2147 family)
VVTARTVLLVAVMLAGSGAASAQQALLGAWMRDDGNVRVNVAPCGNAVCMTNVYVKPGADDKVGERVEFTLQGLDGEKLTGTMYDPKGKTSYPVTVSVAGGTMTTRGCALGGIVCKSVGWTRVN